MQPVCRTELRDVGPGGTDLQRGEFAVGDVEALAGEARRERALHRAKKRVAVGDVQRRTDAYRCGVDDTDSASREELGQYHEVVMVFQGQRRTRQGMTGRITCAGSAAVAGEGQREPLRLPPVEVLLRRPQVVA